MALFSERSGYRAARDVLQFKCMSEELRMAIYNVVFEWLNDYYSDSESLLVCRRLWSELWHLPLDGFPGPSIIDSLVINGPAYDPRFFKKMKSVLWNGEWYAPYDLVEFMAGQYQALDEEGNQTEGYAPRYAFEQVADSNDESLLDGFAVEINEALAREMSGYRLIGTYVVPITNGTEIGALEQGLSAPDRFSGVRMHIGKALEHYSLKPEPDFANSVKESISAVEAAARIIAGSKKDTLASALKKAGKKGRIHQALVDGWVKLYGFTSDVDGVRHASNTDELNVDAALAKYMLISCSAISNYLMELGTLDGAPND